jgi:uncharacterized protein YfkK (UPF0435 family)
MIYQNLDDIYAMIAQEHRRFVAEVAQITETQAAFRPSADDWSIAEIAEHLAITNNGFLRIGFKLLKQAEAAGAPPLSALNLKHVLLTDEGQQNPIKFPAPDVVKPQGGQALAASLAKIEESRAGLEAALPRLKAADCSEYKFPHPAIGPISAYQWLIVWGEHMDRHRQQIQRLKATPGFPA